MGSKLVIWGAGGHAAVVADIVRLQGTYELAGFIDDVNEETHGRPYCGGLILGGREALPQLASAGIRHLIPGIGDNRARVDIAAIARARGFSLATAIHPRAIIAADVAIGEGTVIAAGAVVNPGVSLGEQVIVNTSASIDHDCLIEEGAHIGPGARLAGHVTVRRCARIGIGATIIDRIEIGAGSVIGAGAVVVKNVPPGVVAMGVPARVIRKTIASETQSDT